MASVIITVRTDDAVKRQAQEVFANLGLDMSGAVNAFLRAAIKANGIPFILSNEPDEEYKAVIKRTIEERLERSNNPHTKWYSADEIREVLRL